LLISTFLSFLTSQPVKEIDVTNGFFDIVTPYRVYSLKAESEREVYSWINSINSSKKKNRGFADFFNIPSCHRFNDFLQRTN